MKPLDKMFRAKTLTDLESNGRKFLVDDWFLVAGWAVNAFSHNWSFTTAVTPGNEATIETNCQYEVEKAKSDKRNKIFVGEKVFNSVANHARAN